MVEFLVMVVVVPCEQVAEDASVEMYSGEMEFVSCSDPSRPPCPHDPVATFLNMFHVVWRKRCMPTNW